ncbi:MAG: alpha/beta hydrolase [Pseudomonadota bacterium]
MTEPAPFFAEVADAPPNPQAIWLKTEDNVRIRIVAWRGGARGTAFVFPGRTEYAEKYGPVARRLLERGFSVVVIDWRGQGLSDRLGRTPLQGHVGDFREFQHDVQAMLKAATDLELPANRILVSHSMGGCIGYRALVEGHAFQAAMMAAPMWRLHLRSVLREARMKFISSLRVVGVRKPISVVTTTEPGKASRRFENNPLTSDPVRFAWAQAQVAAHPDLALGPAAFSWTKAALVEMARLRFRPAPTLPILVMVGSDERIVSPEAIRKRVRQVPNFTLLELEGGSHELYQEKDEIQDRVWAAFDGLIAEIDSAAPPEG